MGRTKEFLNKELKNLAGEEAMKAVLKLPLTLSKTQVKRIFCNVYYRMEKQEEKCFFHFLISCKFYGTRNIKTTILKKVQPTIRWTTLNTN